MGKREGGKERRGREEGEREEWEREQGALFGRRTLRSGEGRIFFKSWIIRIEDGGRDAVHRIGPQVIRTFPDGHDSVGVLLLAPREIVLPGAGP